MTGPEHYTKAESLLDRAAISRVRRQMEPEPDDYGSDELMIAAAQVHAMLAAVATALGSGSRERDDPTTTAGRTRRAWGTAAGESSPHT